MKISDIKAKFNSYLLKFKSLPLKKQRLISFLGLAILVIALPVFVFAIGKRTNFFNRAASGEISGEHTPTPKPFTPFPTITPTPTAVPVECIRRLQNVSINPTSSTAILGYSSATFEVTITNNDFKECGSSTFFIRTDGPNSLSDSSFKVNATSTQVYLAPGEAVKINVTFTPNLGISSSTYLIGVFVNGPTGEAFSTANVNVVLPPSPSILPTPTAIVKTPSPTPFPTPVVIQNNNPVITTTFLKVARVKKAYSATISGYDLDAKDKLSMTINSLPSGIKMGGCVSSSNGKIITISCQISGTTKSWGINNIKVTLSDGHTITSKDVLLIVFPF